MHIILHLLENLINQVIIILKYFLIIGSFISNSHDLSLKLKIIHYILNCE